jgi:hypothetical protein
MGQAFLYDRPASVVCDPGDVATPSANYAAVTYPPFPYGFANMISGVAWSYSTMPSAGNLQIQDGSGTSAPY